MWGPIETYLEPNQRSMMELFVKIINGSKPVTIFAKCLIIDFDCVFTLLAQINQYHLVDHHFSSLFLQK